jgi:peptidylprolyl isomerase
LYRGFLSLTALATGGRLCTLAARASTVSETTSAARGENVPAGPVQIEFGNALADNQTEFTEDQVPKSSKRKVARKHAEPLGSPPLKPTAIRPAPDTIWTRFRKNPMAPIGLIVVFTMLVTLVGAGVFGEPATSTPTPAGLANSTPEVTPMPKSTLPASATPSGRTTYATLPPQTVDAAKSYTATILTDKGSMVFTLLPKVAPVTVNSFVFLAREGFYNGLNFHRVEPGFVIQGGDPQGSGMGGPGYSLPADFNATKHLTGTLAMARASDPNSAGSQFYVTLAPASFLDNQYTVFGQIVSGMEVALKIAKGDVMRQVTIEER